MAAQNMTRSLESRSLECSQSTVPGSCIHVTNMDEQGFRGGSKPSNGGIYPPPHILQVALYSKYTMAQVCAITHVSCSSQVSSSSHVSRLTHILKSQCPSTFTI